MRTIQRLLRPAQRVRGLLIFFALVLTGWISTAIGLDLIDPCQPQRLTARTEGPIRDECIVSESGWPIAFTIFEPIPIVAGDRYPLVLHGHGYAQFRPRDSATDKVPRTDVDGDLDLIRGLRESGFGVISIDMRGWGESGGTVRVMDPDFEGRDLVKVVDWAEENLEWLEYRGGNLVLGAFGQSYGGGFQLLLHAVDPKHRLDALVPESTWNNLPYSIAPGGVPKSFWDLFFGAGGEAISLGKHDPFVNETLASMFATNSIPSEAVKWFNYHSLDYFCSSGADYDGVPGDVITPPNGSYTPRLPLRPVDVLLIQGMRDVLFNFNEAYRNYRCLRAAGGDVRLFTTQSGHLQQTGTATLPATIWRHSGFMQDADPVRFDRDRSCGSLTIKDVIVAWFNRKLKHNHPANSDSALLQEAICMSLGFGDDAVFFDADIDFLGGPAFPVAPKSVPVGVAAGDSTTPAVIPLGTVGISGALLAGIPLAKLTVGHPSPVVPPTADPIVFVGLGMRRPGMAEYSLIDDQITPVRGLKTDFEFEMAGVAERLSAGDQLALVVYGNHGHYLVNFSRDPTTPFVNVSGSVRLPIREGSVIP